MKKIIIKNKITDLSTVIDFVHFTYNKFKHSKTYFGHGTDNPWDEAVYLVLGTLQLPVDNLSTVSKKKLTAGEKKEVLKNIGSRIKKRIPVAYLLREAWFAGLPFYVDERVIIPRSPLAELIINRFSPWINSKKVVRILDIGTGSGCIAITCAHMFPQAKIDAIDISSAALKVAKINCIKHKVTKQVHLLRSNLFEKLKGRIYDIIISNPPYVGKSEMKTLPKEYHHEPKTALLAGRLGDEIVVRIMQEAAKHLSPKGILVVEVGNSANIISKRFPRVPFIWLEFASSEVEVFLLTKEQLYSAKISTNPILKRNCATKG